MAVATQNSSQLLELDASQFQRDFPQRGFKVRHTLSDRSEFDLPNLVQLAQRLPEKQVEYYAGQVPVNQDPTKHPKNGLSIVETVKRIEESGSWMVLKNVQSDPQYGSLLRYVLDDVYKHATPAMQGSHREEAFIFISSPNAVTPYHLDEEHNFLLQIRGSKQISLWDPKDRAVLPESQIEHMLQLWHGADYHRNMSYQEEFQQRANVYSLSPGEGLHFPVGAPHWVKNGPAVSVSFSVTFRSAFSEKQAIVYFINGKLRRAGFNPLPPGHSAWKDFLKFNSFQTARSAAKILGGSWFKKNQDKWA